MEEDGPGQYIVVEDGAVKNETDFLACADSFVLGKCQMLRNAEM